MSDLKQQITDTEMLVYAESVADCVLFEWNRDLSMGFATQLRAGSLAKSIVGLLPDSGIFTPLAKEQAASFLASKGKDDLADAIEQLDRQRVTNLVLPWFRNCKIEEADMLLATLRSVPETLRQHQESTSKYTRKKSGPAPKVLPSNYPKLAALGSSLAPMVSKVLAALADGTRKSVPALLEFWKEDYPEECRYLQKNIGQFRAALKDEWLLKRGKKISTRALVIADAMTGAESRLDLRTSFERAREGRRMIKKATP